MASSAIEVGKKAPAFELPDRKVLESHGAWGMKNMYGRRVEGVIRSTVVIDPKGRIAHHWPKVKAAGHAAEVRAKLAELQAR